MHPRLLLLALTFTACTTAPADSGDASTAAADTTGDELTGGADTTTDEASGGPVDGCSLVEPACIDAAIQDLSLQDDKVSDGAVASAKDGGDWVSQVDASAGGTVDAPMNPWVYLRFTDDGLEKVTLDDVAALASAGWDVAAKRYGVRANSGASGPSCVTVAAPGGSYADVTAAPDASEFAAESFYTDECVLIEDGTDLPGSPDYRMAGWWGYNGCVTTTAAPFVLRLADGRAVKLVVESYYGAGQDACNEAGAMGTDAAHMTWRWSFL
jgi:hypothetical protein